MADGEHGLGVDTALTRATRVLVHKEGGEQFIVLPDAFRFDAAELTIWNEGDRLVLSPAEPAAPPQTKSDWAQFWSRIDALRGGDRIVLDGEDAAPDRDP